MNKKRIVITQKLPLDPYEHLSQYNIFYNDCDNPIEYNKLCALVDDIDGILTTVVTKIDRYILDKAKN